MNIRPRFLALLLLTIAPSITAAQRLALTPELAVSDPHPSPIRGDDPVVVATDRGLIEVWTSPTELRATRITSDRTKLEPYGAPISVGKIFPPHSRPALIFNGSTVVAFWNGNDTIYATEFTPDLEVLKHEVEIASVGAYMPEVAWNGRGYLILAGSRRISLDRDLNVVMNTLRVDSPLVNEQLASNGATFVIAGKVKTGDVWQVVARLLLSDGTPAGDAITLDDNVGEAYYRGAPSIIATSAGYAVAWNRGDLELVRVDVPLRVVARTVMPGNGSESIAPNLTSSGSDIVATWQTKDEPSNPFSYAASIRTATFSDALTESGAETRVAAVQWNLSRAISTAVLSGSAFVTWSDGVAMLQRAGSEHDPVTVSAASRLQTEPAIARSSTSLAAAWMEGYSTATAARVAPAVPESALGGGSRTVIASDGIDFLTVTSRGTSLIARRIHADGSVDQPIEIARPASPRLGGAIDVEWDGEEYVVAWGEPQRIGIVRLNRDGAIVGGGEIATNVGVGPALACGDSECVVAWTAPSGVPGATTVDAARLDRYSIVDQTPRLIATSPYPIAKVFIGRNGDESLVVWQDIVATFHFVVTSARLRATRFIDGAPTTSPTDDGFGIGIGDRTPTVFGVRPLDGGFVLLWGESSLLLTQLGENGSADAPSTVEVSSGVSIFSAALGEPSQGRVPLVYERQTTDPFFGSTHRVFFREAILAEARGRTVRSR